MDTKDTDIKQEPTAPGAEGNDGGFPQNNPAECGICFTLFDDIERRPRTLPCGHTFCTSCLIVLLETKNLTCPSCRMKHQTTTINKIPINYNLEEMLRHNKNANTAEGLLPSNEDTTSSKESGTPAGDTFTTIKPSLKNFFEEQSTCMDNAVDDREEKIGQLELYRTHLAKWKQQHDQQMEKMKQLETLNKTISNDLDQEDCRIRDVTKKALMMVDDEAGATEQTNQLSDFTLPLMDKVQILLKYINFEELKQMKPDIRKKVEAGE
ncbi:hypothetical protein Pmani_026394 [Petrolisthes manimaculis]|uniref:RING-type domain-containing protein n=1 Tax=Petrolisthes manimaculis TaxID=1843537 RepID=A0AAE1U058_9EUCA|nr:hypothetical protein Pmani_026394 [Petrolisthes manimaculis]